jgi:hypothetical protein
VAEEAWQGIGEELVSRHVPNEYAENGDRPEAVEEGEA